MLAVHRRRLWPAAIQHWAVLSAGGGVSTEYKPTSTQMTVKCLASVAGAGQHPLSPGQCFMLAGVNPRSSLRLPHFHTAADTHKTDRSKTNMSPIYLQRGRQNYVKAYIVMNGFGLYFLHKKGYFHIDRWNQRQTTATWNHKCFRAVRPWGQDAISCEHFRQWIKSYISTIIRLQNLKIVKHHVYIYSIQNSKKM